MRSYHVIILFLCVVAASADSGSDIRNVIRNANETELIIALKCIMTFIPEAVNLIFSHLSDTAPAVWNNIPKIRECIAGDANGESSGDKPTCLLSVVWAIVKELLSKATVDYSRLKFDFTECLDY